MNRYDVLFLIKNADNVDKLDEIFLERCFNTSVMTAEIYEEIKEQAIIIFKMGETDVYSFIKDRYNLKV